MKPIVLYPESQEFQPEADSWRTSGAAPYFSLIVPVFNEATLIEKNLLQIISFFRNFSEPHAGPAFFAQSSWEMIVVNDGSTDLTGVIATRIAATNESIRVYHHQKNLGLGAALRTGFSYARGEFVLPLDLDLSYSLDQIGALLRCQQLRPSPSSAQQIFVLSPYMRNGKVSNVPLLRLWFSRLANLILYFAQGRSLHTSTSMVRLLPTSLVQQFALTSNGPEINLEILHKAQLAGAHLVEIPAHLNWCHRLESSLLKEGRRFSKQMLPRKFFKQVGFVLQYSLKFALAKFINSFKPPLRKAFYG